MTDRLAQTIARIQPLDRAAMNAAEARQAQLTKPPRALGRLEALSIQLAGISAKPRPRLEHKAVAVMAADHGVVAEGVSAFPAEVTPGMVMNFVAGIPLEIKALAADPFAASEVDAAGPSPRALHLAPPPLSPTEEEHHE